MKKLKLTKLSKNIFKKVIGGQHVSCCVSWGDCGCGCMYEGKGGSSTSDNFSANIEGGLHSKNTFAK